MTDLQMAIETMNPETRSSLLHALTFHGARHPRSPLAPIWAALAGIVAQDTL